MNRLQTLISFSMLWLTTTAAAFELRPPADWGSWMAGQELFENHAGFYTGLDRNGHVRIFTIDTNGRVGLGSIWTTWGEYVSFDNTHVGRTFGSEWIERNGFVVGGSAQCPSYYVCLGVLGGITRPYRDVIVR